MKDDPKPQPMVDALLDGTFGEKYLGQKPAPAPPPSEGGGVLRLCSYCKTWNSKPCGEQCCIQANDPTWDQLNPTCASLRSGAGEAGSWTVEGEMGSAGKSVPLDVLRAKFARDVESDSIVGSCGCMTKTPEVKYHKPGCKYRIISERDEAREQISALQHALGEARAEREKEAAELVYLRNVLIDLRSFGATLQNWFPELNNAEAFPIERARSIARELLKTRSSLATLTRERDEARAKIEKVQRMMDIAHKADDPKSEMEIATSATFAEAMAHAHSDLLQSERDSALTCLHTLAGALEGLVRDFGPEWLQDDAPGNTAVRKALEAYSRLSQGADL